jgi:prepilin-type N-terminal cleavage/methylation domain-containing protein
MRKFNNKKGFTLIELIIVTAIIGILVSTVVPKFLHYEELSRIAVDKYNVSILNKITPLYCIINTSSNPFEDETKSNGELIEVLVSNGYITSTVQPQRKDVTFTWIFNEERWYLKNLD